MFKYRLFIKVRGKGFNPAGFLDSVNVQSQDNIDPIFNDYEDAVFGMEQWIRICRDTDNPVVAALIVSTSGSCEFHTGTGTLRDGCIPDAENVRG